jgi:hypothetical protein
VVVVPVPRLVRLFRLAGLSRLLPQLALALMLALATGEPLQGAGALPLSMRRLPGLLPLPALLRQRLLILLRQPLGEPGVLLDALDADALLLVSLEDLVEQILDLGARKRRKGGGGGGGAGGGIVGDEVLRCCI